MCIQAEAGGVLEDTIDQKALIPTDRLYYSWQYLWGHLPIPEYPDSLVYCALHREKKMQCACNVGCIIQNPFINARFYKAKSSVTVTHLTRRERTLTHLHSGWKDLLPLRTLNPKTVLTWIRAKRGIFCSLRMTKTKFWFKIVPGLVEPLHI